MRKAADLSGPEQTYEFAARDGSTAFHLVLGGRPVRVNIAGRALADIVEPAFAHLRDDVVADPDLTILVWDSEATGVGLPQPLPAEDEWSTSYDETGGVFTAVHHNGRLALVCVRRHDFLPAWDIAHPLRRAISTWARARGLIIVHAAAVGEGSGGLLVVGPGGSGKSTTALAWIATGGHSAGDDYILLEPGLPPVAYSMFATMRLHLDHARRFDGLLPAIDSVERQDTGREKATVNVAAALPGVLERRMPIFGLVFARIGNGSRSRVTPLPARRALLELMNSSLAQFLQADINAPAGLPVGFRVMGDLCRTVPCAQLEIGGSPFEIPVVLRSWLVTLRSAAAVSL